MCKIKECENERSLRSEIETAKTIRSDAMENNKSEQEIIEELNREKEELDKKVNKLIGSFDYYNKLVEDIGNMFAEYEISENVVCFSSCLTDENIITTDNIELNYVVKVLCSNNVFQFRAVDFEDKNTKFNVTIYKDNKQESNYNLNTLDDVKGNIIKWLISM